MAGYIFLSQETRRKPSQIGEFLFSSQGNKDIPHNYPLLEKISSVMRVRRMGSNYLK